MHDLWSSCHYNTVISIRRVKRLTINLYKNSDNVNYIINNVKSTQIWIVSSRKSLVCLKEFIILFWPFYTGCGVLYCLWYKQVKCASLVHFLRARINHGIMSSGDIECFYRREMYLSRLIIISLLVYGVILSRIRIFVWFVVIWG